MANEEHLKILRQGVEVWNRWRKEVPYEGPILSGVDLSKANLRYADFSQAELSGARLRGADLVYADLSYAELREAELGGAKLSQTDLRGADLGKAYLRGARLRYARLSHANLGEADLTHANLCDADLCNADLCGAILRGAVVGRTTFAILDLSETEGLGDVVHRAPSAIDVHTLRQSGRLPDVFLRGCGLADDEIDHLLSLFGTPSDFYSCFISYSHEDKSFANRLHDALQRQGIRCWLDERDANIGEPIHEAIDRGFRLTDRVVLIASVHSLSSTWVSRELNKTFGKEEEQRRSGQLTSILLPLNLDGYLFRRDGNDEYVWRHGWADEIRNRIAAEFTGWESDNTKFEEQLGRVVKALRADEGARETPPDSRL